MPKYFFVCFPKSDEKIKAVLLEGKAPQTCEAFWKLLTKERELDTSGRHAMYTGKEISVQLSEEVSKGTILQDPPEENLTCFPLPGDFLYTYMPPYAFGGNPSAIFDVGLFYGRDTRTFFPMGWLPGNHFAQVADEEELRKLEDMGRFVANNGPQPIKFEICLE